MMNKITTKLKAALSLALFTTLSSVDAQDILISQGGTVNVSGGKMHVFRVFFAENKN